MGVEDEEEENREVGSFWAKPFACQIDRGETCGTCSNRKGRN